MPKLQKAVPARRVRDVLDTANEVPVQILRMRWRVIAEVLPIGVVKRPHVRVRLLTRKKEQSIEWDKIQWDAIDPGFGSDSGWGGKSGFDNRLTGSKRRKK